MDGLPANFSFKENVLVLCIVSAFFGLAAAVVTLACFIKVGDSLVWLVPGLAAALLTLFLLLFSFNAFRSRQIVSITPQSIRSRSSARGEVEIPWHEVEKVAEDALKGENVRRAMPGLEVILAMYINLPIASNGEGRSLITIKGPGERTITLRSHLLYPHRLEQLRQAISRYAPQAGQGARLLRLNLNN